MLWGFSGPVIPIHLLQSLMKKSELLISIGDIWFSKSDMIKFSLNFYEEIIKNDNYLPYKSSLQNLILYHKNEELKNHWDFTMGLFFFWLGLIDKYNLVAFLVPLPFFTSSRSSVAIVGSLDGSEDSWRQSMSILRALVKVASHTVLDLWEKSV